jgi:hypothetical protein
MLARRADGALEQPPPLRHRFGRVHLSQAPINLLMFLVHAIQLPVVGEDMVQRQIGQVGFPLGVVLQQAFDDPGHGPHLRRGRQTRQDLLDLIEHSQINGVLGP